MSVANVLSRLKDLIDSFEDFDNSEAEHDLLKVFSYIERSATMGVRQGGKIYQVTVTEL